MRLAPGFSFLVIAAMSARAGVFTVGGPDGDFASIQAAVDAAADGDTILVREGTFFETIRIDGKAIAVAADDNPDPTVVGSLLIENVPAGATVVWAGVRVDASGLASPGLVVRDVAGSVRVMKTEVQGGPGLGEAGYAGAVIQDAGDVAFSKCHLLGGHGLGLDPAPGRGAAGGEGCYARDSQVALFDCLIYGGDGADSTDPAWDGGPGAPAYRSPDAWVFAMGNHTFGGSGGDGAVDLPSGACSAGGAGGAGYLLKGDPGASATLLDNDLAPGLGGASAGTCSAGADGPDWASLSGGTIAVLPETRKSLRIQSPSYAGQPSTVILQGQPGDRAYVMLSKTPGFVTTVPLWIGPTLVGLPIVRRLYVGDIGANGSLTTMIPTPVPPPGEEELVWFVQGLVVEPDGTAVVADTEPWVIVSGP